MTPPRRIIIQGGNAYEPREEGPVLVEANDRTIWPTFCLLCAVMGLGLLAAYYVGGCQKPSLPHTEAKP